MDKRGKNKRRKKRLRAKRIKASAVLIAFAVLIFFAVKGLVGLVTGEGVESRSSLPESVPQIIGESSSVIMPAKPEKNRFTVLVNRENPLAEDYSVQTRKVVYNGSESDKLFDVRAAESLEAMLNDAKAAGYPMYLVSTYRTVSYQKGLFGRKVQEYLNYGYTQAAAEEEAAKWVAIPGTSEHNLGLAADIVSSTWYNENNDLTQEFENTGHFVWLYEHCADYGFILRYPSGKESVTGIVYEPWHYRYVGQEAAQYIMENNLTLEEFWEN